MTDDPKRELSANRLEDIEGLLRGYSSENQDLRKKLQAAQLENRELREMLAQIAACAMLRGGR